MPVLGVAAVGIKSIVDDPGPADESPWEYRQTANELVAVETVVCGTSTSVF